ncbi:MAG: 50S ribosomal protein L17 [Candidatus Sumerlaeia bacterium]
MRHRKHRSKLNRTSEHRLALMRNLTAALIEHERIHTTQVKAVQLRPFVETLVTIARRGTLADKRLALSRLPQRDAVVKLFDVIAPRVENRAGGYLRIVKDARRMGDGAPMAYIEFVDRPAEGTEEEPKKKTLKQRKHERRKEVAKMRKEAKA